MLAPLIWNRWYRPSACAVLALLPAMALAQMIPSGQQPAMLKKVRFDQNLNQQLPLELTFKDETGHTVRLGQYFRYKPVILALVYYQCPMLCNLELNGLAKSMRAIKLSAGEDFDVVTVSFDPRETPHLAFAKKESYLEKYSRKHANEGWHFLTGQEPAIKALADSVGFHYAYDPVGKQFAHASGIIVLTPEGKISRYFYGVEYPPKDLRLGLVEASNNKIGSPVDQLLLYCYHYDPTTGKYGLVIMNVIRALASATALALGTFLVVMFRRERRNGGPDSWRSV
jgi:protein SCO1